MNFLETYWTDVYKTGHKFMLPPGSTLMYSNFTPRNGKHSNCPNNGELVSIGQQMTVRKLHEDWQNNFFKRPVEEIDQFGADMTAMLMLKEPYDVTHFKELHALGYLPIRIKAIEEGEVIPYKIPLFTIVNTQPINNQVFDWLVNYLETILSAESWQAPTSATLGLQMRKLGLEWCEKTDPENKWFVDFQFHDFSMRGMGGKSAIVNSGLGFASCSKGSDTLPVIPAARKYYDETEPCVFSVMASEHAIMCTLTGFFLQQEDGTWDKVGDFEYKTFLYLIKKFNTGVLSLVMDTWDLWRVISDYLVRAKDEILARDGKVVIRPDSGNPVDIICGEPKKALNGELPEMDGEESTYKRRQSPAELGVVEGLWNIFGGDESSTGYKRLNPKIGTIYGDSINYVREQQMFERLAAKGFASTNIVLGVGSYSLQFATRDTHGFAQKATYVEVNGQGIEIFKDPVTDDGVKKSAKGLLRVDKTDGVYTLKDQCSWEEEAGGELKVIYENGMFFNQTTLTKIRSKLM